MDDSIQHIQISSDHFLEAWQKILTILAERTIAFQKILVYNRRRAMLRMRRRQAVLRLQYFHRLIDIQNKFLLQIPRPVKKRLMRTFINTGYWDTRGIEGFSDKEWLETFRMSKKTFIWLCENIEEEISPRGSRNRKPIPLYKRVAMSIYKLSTGSEYRIVSDLFGVARSTVCKFVRLFCEILATRMTQDVVTMPTHAEAMQIGQGFEKICKLPMVIGSVGITHVPINPPSEGIETFLNASGWPSIVLQAMIDHKYRFRKIDMNSRDPSLFTESSEDLPIVTKTVKKVTIPSYLVGTSIFPLQPWLMKEYTNPTTEKEINFNAAIHKINDISTEGFRRLFARWKVLTKKVDIDHRNMIMVILSCCALHNIIETNDDGYNQKWPNALDPQFEDFQPKILGNMIVQDSTEGYGLRKALTNLM